jgi:hypothetical protein
MREIGKKPAIETAAKQPAAALSALALAAMAALIASGAQVQKPAAEAPRAYLGFDRNIYPGDDAMRLLRKDFVFTSYWLSPPPGEKTNTWTGKRGFLRSQGFGFSVLFRGRDSHELTNKGVAARLGSLDAKIASAAAKTEGFPASTIIYLDIEEGGRLPTTYHTYLAAWASGLFSGSYHPAVYCSGMPVKEGRGISITTAEDIRINGPSPGFFIWVYNDACPPSPGCAFPQNPPAPARSGIAYAAVWQFAQSPRRKEFTARCTKTYHADGNCYAPVDTTHSWFLDVNSSSLPDPSSPGNILPIK